MSFILNGQKTIESRLNKGKFKNLQIGDILIIGPEEKKFIIDKLTVYKSFREILEKEGIENIIPDKKTLDEAGSVYYNFYTKKQEEEFGVIAIGIKPQI